MTRCQGWEQLSVSKPGYTTYQLTVILAPGSRNVYAVFGKDNSPMSFPPAFQVPAPFGANIGGVSPAFYQASADAQFDSWLTVGTTDGSASGGISSVGIDFTSWTESAGLSATDGAVFWMDPDSGAAATGGNPVVVAQLTVPVTTPFFTATAGAQGRSTNGLDWEEINLMWSTSGVTPPPSPPPPPPPAPPVTGAGGAVCSSIRQTVVNSCVGTDENGDPVPRSHGCDGCVDPTTRIPTDTFLAMVRDDDGVYCTMPDGTAADVLMTCLCSDPPTCTRGEDRHNQAIDPFLPPNPAVQGCTEGHQPSSGGGCQTCNQNLFSPDGTACQVCPPGSGIVNSPDGLNIGCDLCTSPMYSPDGVACVRCPIGKEPDESGTRCITSIAPPPPPGAGTGGLTEDEDNIATAVVSQTMVDGIADHTTYRVAVHVTGDAENIYTIYGKTQGEDHPMEIPAARQVPTPYGVDIAGVNPAFFPINAEAQYDSWLTVGTTGGDSSNQLSSIGIEWDSWHDYSGLHITDGAVFWMEPDFGPTTADKDPVVMQLTVPSGCSFHGVFNAQGRTRAGSIDGNWDARNIQFHGGPGGECQQARAPPPPPPTAPRRHDNSVGTTDSGPSTLPPPPPPTDGESGGSSTGTIVVVLLLIVVGGAAAKKKMDGGGGASDPDGGIYAKDIVSDVSPSSACPKVTLMAFALALQGDSDL